MRVLIATIHHPVGSGRYMYDAFKRIGVDVRSIGPNPGVEIWDTKLAPQREWRGDGTWQTFWPDWRPDLIVVMDPEPYHHQYYHDVPHVIYSVDNHVYNLRQDGIAHYFLAHLHGQEMPARGEDVTWLPCAYDPIHFTPSPIPWRERQFDVAMIGCIYPRRLEILKAMDEAGIVVAAKVGLVYEEFREVYHHSRISLCSSFRSDVAQRVFETAALGCVVLSDPCPDYDALGVDSIVLYRDAADAVRSARALLANPEVSQSLIEKTSAWVRPHTWDARAKTICDWWQTR